MEPSPQGVMKFCNEFEGYTRKITCQPFGSQEDCEISVPRSHALHPTDTMPDEGRDAIRELIKTCFPALADRPLFDTAMCWCNDSFDGHWLLTEHPIYKGLYVASGDSGHTFKMLPIVGKYVADLLEDKVSSFQGPQTRVTDTAAYAKRQRGMEMEAREGRCRRRSGREGVN